MSYRSEFDRVMARADEVLGFDPVKLAELADVDLIRTVEDYAIRVRNFAGRFHRALQD